MLGVDARLYTWSPVSFNDPLAGSVRVKLATRSLVQRLGDIIRELYSIEG